LPALGKAVEKLDEASRVRNPQSDQDGREKLYEMNDDSYRPHAGSAPYAATGRGDRHSKHPNPALGTRLKPMATLVTSTHK
jgi:hypothetical protein